MGKTIAITGVNSYFASTILPRLQADPEVDKIIGLDVSPWKGGYGKVDFHRLDIRSDKLAEVIAGADALYHLAFVVGEIQDKRKTRDININGSKNVFQACLDNHVKKVIYASSTTVYGSHRDNPLGFTEDSPLAGNEDSYYNTSKVEVENFVTAFFAGHPEVTLTVLRTGLLIGPKIDNMFSRLWSMKITALPSGNISHNQFIHEVDLGQALYLAWQQDLPGVYNVTADDAVPTRWCFKQSRARVIYLPAPLLKLIADIAFKLRLFPAGGGWVSVSRYTIFCHSDKFKAASGWLPRYTSREAFFDYLESRQRERDNIIQAVLSWIFKSGRRTRPTMEVLHIFKLGKIPGIRRMIPWMNPEKNSITYLPVNKSLGEASSQALPAQALHDFIDKASIHVIMDKCGCRLGHDCQNYTHDVGCLFMGQSALKIPHGVSRRVTPRQAHDHVERAINAGLVPMTGKVRVDNFIFLTPDRSQLLSVCFCCPCCCMMTAFKHMPGDYLDGVMPILEGVKVEVQDNCVGCGTCLDACGFGAISIVNGRAVHDNHCRGCGRCVTYCPHEAVQISIDNPRAVEEIKQRIESYVEF
ncbi:MAG: NAD-dependent epimerase/dehydratase family protein [Desulfosudaceae bacterium]